MTQWETDCIKHYGTVLTGKYSHWCDEWDDLPIDESCFEFAHCSCYDSEEARAIQEQLAAEHERAIDESPNDGI